jgi:hypothetical protein
VRVPIVAKATRPGAGLAQNTLAQPNFVSDNPVPNIRGKSILAVVVDCPPGVSNPPHRHARDISALDEPIRREIAHLPGVERTVTTVCMKTIKEHALIAGCL